jgi:hypothetical protein
VAAKVVVATAVVGMVAVTGVEAKAVVERAAVRGAAAMMMTEPAATLMFTYSSLTPAELAKLVRSSDVTDSV